MANGVMTLWRLKGCRSSTEHGCSKGKEKKKNLIFLLRRWYIENLSGEGCNSGAETEELKLGFGEQSSSSCT